LEQRSKKIAEVRNAPFVPIGRVGHGESDRTVTGFVFREAIGMLPKRYRQNFASHDRQRAKTFPSRG
jgi:hypothetical protein